MLNIDDTALVVIDIQEKLAAVMLNREQLIASVRKLIQGMQVFDIPILATEQYPEGLGATVGEIAELLAGVVIIPKVSFSCCG